MVHHQPAANSQPATHTEDKKGRRNRRRKLVTRNRLETKGDGMDNVDVAAEGFLNPIHSSVSVLSFESYLRVTVSKSLATYPLELDLHKLL